MKPASLKEIKASLTTLSHQQLQEICLRLARHRKENKELVTYLLFEADDPQLFVSHVKEETEQQFSMMNTTNLYLAKKTIRKVLGTTNKYIKFSGSRQSEVELLIHFCRMLKDSGVPLGESPVLYNLYRRQIQKIGKAMSFLHEDLQHDYGKQLEEL